MLAERGFVCWQAATPIEGQSAVEMPYSRSNGRAGQGSSLDRDHCASPDSVAGRSLRSKRFFNSDGAAE